jgi:hypothetical protein
MFAADSPLWRVLEQISTTVVAPWLKFMDGMELFFILKQNSVKYLAHNAYSFLLLPFLLSFR